MAIILYFGGKKAGKACFPFIIYDLRIIIFIYTTKSVFICFDPSAIPSTSLRAKG